MAKYKIIPSSRTIVQSPISIGHKAEKGVEAIEFDLTAWVGTYGSGTLTVIMRRWGDAIPYPIALDIDEDNKATWTLSDIDTAKAGMAYAQLNYIVGDEVVKKSDIYTFRVMDSLTGEGEPPEAYESWLEHLTHLAAEAMAEVLDIEGIVTDKTLTVDGGIADGKATGDALALKADKSTTYTKTEVDRMIEGVEVETDTTLEVAGAAADAAETGRQIGLLKADLGSFKETGGADKYFSNVKVYGSPASIGISNIRNNYGSADAKQTGFAIFPATSDTEWGSAIKNVTNAVVSGHFKETLGDGRTYEFDYDLSGLASGSRDTVRDAAHVIKKERFYDIDAIVVDATLTQPTQAADAKAAGDAIEAINDILDEVTEEVHTTIEKEDYVPIPYELISQTYTYNGITYIQNTNETINVSGTASDISLASLTDQERNALSFYLVTGKTYRMKGCPAGGSNNTYRLDLRTAMTGGAVAAIDTGNGVDFTVSSAGQYYPFIRIQSGQTIDLLFSPEISELTKVEETGDFPSAVDIIARQNKVDKQYGTENEGKALVIDSEGFVSLGSAGISDVAKVALLNCLKHVAFVDDTGESLIEDLENALNVEPESDERIVFELPSGTDISDSTIDTGVSVFPLGDSFTVLAKVSIPQWSTDLTSSIFLNHGSLSTGTFRTGIDCSNNALHFGTNVMYSDYYAEDQPGYSGGVIPSNVPHEVVWMIRMRGNTAKKVLYVDGVKLLGKEEDITSYATNKSFTGNYVVGGLNTTDMNNHLPGVVGMLRIYNEALEASEIESIMDLAF